MELPPQTSVEPGQLIVMLSDRRTRSAASDRATLWNAEQRGNSAVTGGAVHDVTAAAVLLINLCLLEVLNLRRLRAVIADELAHVTAGDHLQTVPPCNPQALRCMGRRADLRGVDICGDGPALACGLLHVHRDRGRDNALHWQPHGSPQARDKAIGQHTLDGMAPG